MTTCRRRACCTLFRPARRGWCISQLPQPARRLLRPRLFLQVVWLACKTATAETAARDLVASVFRYVGLPRRARQTATCASPARSQRACKRRSAHRPSSARRTLTKAPSKVERVNGAIADALRSAAGEPVDDWPALAPLVEFAQRLGLAPQALQSAPTRRWGTMRCSTSTRASPTRSLPDQLRGRHRRIRAGGRPLPLPAPPPPTWTGRWWTGLYPTGGLTAADCVVLLYVRLCTRGAFSHVVAYTRQTSALPGRGTAGTRLRTASAPHGSCRVLFEPPFFCQCRNHALNSRDFALGSNP